jgi:hypothetical protein
VNADFIAMENSWNSRNLLKKFEAEMIERSAKVKDSADAATFLHSEIVLQSR